MTPIAKLVGRLRTSELDNNLADEAAAALQEQAAQIQRLSAQLEATRTRVESGQLRLVERERNELEAKLAQAEAALRVLADLRHWDMFEGPQRVADSDYWCKRIDAALAAAGSEKR